MINVINMCGYMELQEGFASDVKVKAALREPDTEAWKTLCLTFLKGQS
jgi:hypothetical protein